MLAELLAQAADAVGSAVKSEARGGSRHAQPGLSPQLPPGLGLGRQERLVLPMPLGLMGTGVEE